MRQLEIAAQRTLSLLPRLERSEVTMMEAARDWEVDQAVNAAMNTITSEEGEGMVSCKRKCGSVLYPPVELYGGKLQIRLMWRICGRSGGRGGETPPTTRERTAVALERTFPSLGCGK